MIVERATRADAAILRELLTAQLREHDIPTDGEQLVRAIDGVLHDPSRGFLLLARHGGEALGVAYVSFIWSIEHGGQSAWLDELYVIPAERGRGIGKLLLDAVIAGVRAAGALAIDLEVEADHARAENLYAREGFQKRTRQRWVRML